jgi:hypothetical protein
MQFTRIFCGANSIARLLVNAWTPPLVVEEPLHGVAFASDSKTDSPLCDPAGPTVKKT